MQKFTWQLHDDEDLWFERIQELHEDDINELLREGFIEEKVVLEGRDETMYSRKVGNVWIGRISKI